MAYTDPYDDIARFYDLEHAEFRDDIDFYLNVLDDGPVLEIGAGTGRVTERLIAAGLEVWGIDSSPSMLARARDRLGKSPRSHLIEASVLELNLNKRFPFLILPLNTLWHIGSQHEQLAALAVVRRHARMGARIIVDLTNPLTMADRGSTGELRVRFVKRDGEATVTGLSAAWDDEGTQTIHLSLMYDVGTRASGVFRTRSELDLRYIYASELRLMLAASGFSLDNLYGSYELDQYSSTSPGLLAVARAI